MQTRPLVLVASFLSSVVGALPISPARLISQARLTVDLGALYANVAWRAAFFIWTKVQEKDRLHFHGSGMRSRRISGNAVARSTLNGSRPPVGGECLIP
jgi:hypothetical protein